MKDKTKPAKNKDNSDGDEKTVSAKQPEVFEIDVNEIVPSPFEAQALRRRLEFETETGQEGIRSLGDSILAKGLLQPIMVRPRGDKFEIVYGERRWLAHKEKGIDKIFSFVRELSDEDTNEMQYYENHERKEANALEDALRFKFYILKGYSEEYIASRFSTTKTTVRKKLRLNNLIADALTEFAEGLLPLKHAYYLATFPPESQQKIVEREYAYEWRGKDFGAVSFDEFKEIVEENIVRNLATAPFDTHDTRLHVTGLVCSECPQNTGFNKKLFEDDFKGEKCLNESCFTVKTNTYAKLQQQELAEEMIATTPDEVSGEMPEKTFEEKLKAVPLVTEKSTVNKKELPVKGNVLTDQELHDEPECEYSVKALAIDGAKKNQKVYVCQNDKCPFHHPEKIVEEKSDANAPSEQELRRNQFQFDAKVRFAVREKVFPAAVKVFTDTNVFWQFDDLIQELLKRLWFRVGSDVQNFILTICKDWKNLPKDKSSKEQIERFVESLDKEKQSSLLFLFTFYTVGMYSNSDPAELEEFTYRFTKIDYYLLEQETRLELAPEEFKDLANLNLQYVRNGHLGKVENFWWNEPKEAD